jgi:hypothetical protein
MLQELVNAERRLRALVLGERVLVVDESDPEALIDAASAERAAVAARTLARAIGYDVCGIELAQRAGELVVQKCDPFPALDPRTLGSRCEQALGWLLEAVEAIAWGPPAGTRTRRGWG